MFDRLCSAVDPWPTLAHLHRYAISGRFDHGSDPGPDRCWSGVGRDRRDCDPKLQIRPRSICITLGIPTALTQPSHRREIIVRLPRRR
jgi:hypothetical protein